jgi:EAL domain-containing protein (putative c-di-GMP-specific phosphodiesterase class I)
VAICTEMGVKVIAEGIESDAQVAAMAALGCGYGQGHRYGRPRPLVRNAPELPRPMNSLEIALRPSAGVRSRPRTGS